MKDWHEKPSLLDTLDELVNSVPVYLLECRADEEAVRITLNKVFNNQ